MFKGRGPKNIVGRVDRSSPERYYSTTDQVSDYRSNLSAHIGKEGIIYNHIQRQNCEFGWRVINNTIWEQDFWNRSRELKEYVTEMIVSLDYTMNGKTSEEVEATLVKLCFYLKQIREKHLAAIKSLLMIEETSGSPQKDRRDVLLNWNRGARTYARDVLQLARDAQYPNLKPFENELLQLDDCRMLLWSPDNSTEVAELRTETTTIKSTIDHFENGRYVNCMAEIDSLMAAPDRSVFAESVARIVRSCLPPNLLTEDNRLDEANEMAKFFEERLKETCEQSAKLARMQNVTMLDALQKWIPHFTTWSQVARDNAAKIQSESLP